MDIGGDPGGHLPGTLETRRKPQTLLTIRHPGRDPGTLDRLDAGAGSIGAPTPRARSGGNRSDAIRSGAIVLNRSGAMVRRDPGTLETLEPDR